MATDDTYDLLPAKIAESLPPLYATQNAAQLVELSSPLGLKIERDLSFEPQPVSHCE